MDLYAIYLLCFAVGLVFAIVSALFADFGGGSDVNVGGDVELGHGDFSAGSHDMPGMSALSPTSIGSFITAFGGLGMIFSKIDATSAPHFSLPLSAVGGAAIAGGVVLAFRTVFQKTQSSSEGRVGTLVGKTCTVITSIPQNGIGEIAYVQAGSRYTAPARVVDGVPVPVGKAVKIERIVGTEFFVTTV